MQEEDDTDRPQVNGLVVPPAQNHLRCNKCRRPAPGRQAFVYRDVVWRAKPKSPRYVWPWMPNSCAPSNGSPGKRFSGFGSRCVGDSVFCVRVVQRPEQNQGDVPGTVFRASLFLGTTREQVPASGVRPDHAEIAWFDEN
eukprot:CAMPEP_0168166722 /NCGR_PEP_ID=MMETSP0139_2-20121125/2179_1 /TAXON_ID=44445 /ORGANISM="Pseudo-nitzschia australis, Strain 10249 10 AB" /LENGTH=139 /DNA_ID=CAMNT_0008083939 /DNA_START=267 /DNA_END=683 /DNA_ORIENTATION=-